jgi:nucleoside-diphosphate-sugar epimerase
MFDSTKVALVTGATGYIGSAIVGFLIQKDWKVYAVSRLESDSYLLERQVSSERLSLERYDGSYESLLSIMVSSKPDIVFHLASCVSNGSTIQNIDSMLESNLKFGVYLAQAMQECGVKNMINTGSYWQYFNGDGYDPLDFYAATKEAYQTLLQYYRNVHGFSIINLILYDVYGPNDPRKKLLNSIRNAFNGAFILDTSPGEQKIHLVHVTDVARAYQIAAQILLNSKKPIFYSYSVCSDKLITLKQLVETIEGILGVAVPVNFGGRPYREREILEPWSGERLVGWVPAVTLERGLEEIFKD